MSNRERTRGRGLQNLDIANLLNDSDLEDFTPSDENIGDPPFVIRPENRCSSSSETDEDEDVHINSRSANRGSRSSRSRSRGRAHGFRNASVRSRTTQEVGTVQPFVDGTSSGLPLDVPSTNGWTSGSFAPKELVLTEPSYLIVNSQEQIDYFRQYIDDDLVNLIVEKTNQTAVKLHGRNLDLKFGRLNLDLNECYVYIGITMVMASVNFPNLRMYFHLKDDVCKVPITCQFFMKNSPDADIAITKNLGLHVLVPVKSLCV